MRKFVGIILLLAFIVPILANWTCPYCGRENYDKDKFCRWCRDGAPY